MVRATELKDTSMASDLIGMAGTVTPGVPVLEREELERQLCEKIEAHLTEQIQNNQWDAEEDSLLLELRQYISEWEPPFPHKRAKVIDLDSLYSSDSETEEQFDALYGMLHAHEKLYDPRR